MTGIFGLRLFRGWPAAGGRFGVSYVKPARAGCRGDGKILLSSFASSCMSTGVPLSKKFLAELIGTFWLVFGGCGSAVLAAVFPYAQAESNPLGLGFLGVALAFGLTLLTMAYTIGHISGCHINPAVSFGLWAGGRLPGSHLVPYIVAQVLGGIIAGGLLYGIANGRKGFELSGSNPLATNGFGAHSPGGYGFWSALIIEVLLTFIFLLVIWAPPTKKLPWALLVCPSACRWF
jgi:aquaporin Z